MTGILARRQLRLSVRALVSTFTGVTVKSPGSWSTPPNEFPYIALRCGSEHKTSKTRSMPVFDTMVTLEIFARVQAATDDEAQDALEALGLQIENAVIAAPVLIGGIQQVASINTQSAIKSEAERPVGEILMSVDLEVFEDYDPTEINPDDYPELQQMLLHIDTAAPFDATGTYPSPPFPAAVTPAPRTSGPDGRDEATLQIDLT